MSPLLSLENITRTIPAGGSGGGETTVLQGIDLSLRRGQIIAVCGPSGSGKTTLLGVAGLLWRPTGGRIRVKGEDITKMSRLFWNRVRRQGIGFCFQQFALLRRIPAWENVAIPLISKGMSSRERKERSTAVMIRLGLEDKVHLATEKLSGGEKQRLALARAVVAGPEIVIADEPVSNVDLKTADLVFHELRRARKRGTAVLVSGLDHEWKGLADRQYRLETGRLSSCEVSDVEPDANE